jgi:hypothetical protein
MKNNLIYCDLCGTEKEELPKHWSSSMDKLHLEFEKFPNIQSNITVDDCCMNCAQGIFKLVCAHINSKTKVENA